MRYLFFENDAIYYYSIWYKKEERVAKKEVTNSNNGNKILKDRSWQKYKNNVRTTHINIE